MLVLVRGENRSTRRKTYRSKGENQQQTQPTCQHRGLNPGRIGGKRVFSLLRHPCAMLHVRKELYFDFVNNVGFLNTTYALPV